MMICSTSQQVKVIDAFQEARMRGLFGSLAHHARCSTLVGEIAVIPRGKRIALAHC